MSSMVKREMVEVAMAHGVCFILTKPTSTNSLMNVWQHVYRHQIKAKQKSEYNVNNLIEVMDNTSCANNKIQDRKGKGIMNPSNTYHDQEVGALLEKDKAKGSERIRSIDEESPNLDKKDHSLGSKDNMEGQQKKRRTMEWTLKLDKKFKEVVHMLGDKEVVLLDNGHHFNTFNHLPDKGHHFNVLDSKDFPINFNESLQDGYLSQPPAVPSLIPPDDFFTGLEYWNQEPELNNFNGEIKSEQG
ncbi:Trans-acting T-cell-specific transcription factor GATA-3 [Datura stramonium]|uniref:Trans-acting T-cell-specific transcription factor GATA-3 n=1 Tax=Datura stramonium TaxID=4076 RepID=A0ABS8WGJ6_DATST|nr:Trans-acting T-cell-specific transcription factor GATA-3 [Datura stramonium]